MLRSEASNETNWAYTALMLEFSSWIAIVLRSLKQIMNPYASSNEILASSAVGYNEHQQE